MKIARVALEDSISYAVIDGNNAHLFDGTPFGAPAATGVVVSLDDCRLLAPVMPGKIVCVGKNYRDHAAEMGGEVPAEPLLFLKPTTSVIGPGDTIRKPPGVKRLDHEAELALVIGSPARFVSEDDAMNHVLGVTCGNDVSARDYQASDGQWTRAKGFDTFCPLGPWIETELDIKDVAVQSRLNGEPRQDASTADLVFPPAFLVSYISRIMTLLPGDVIMTGTPAGVGPMEPGDDIEIEIAGIGVLRNVVEEGR